MAVYLRRKQYVPSRNSFMQLEKSAAQRPQISPLDLNTITFVEAVERGSQQNSDATTVDTAKNSSNSNSSHESPV